jgi:DNA/RNA-binding domain of Phe-tRNA-synthetase-like protein
MKISINKEVFENLNPKFKVLLISAKNIDNQVKFKESLNLLNEISELIKLTFNKETIKNHHLISPWAVAQEEFGEKAKHYHTSVERLIRKVISKKSINEKDTLTNVLRYLALKHIVPFGVDDYDKIQGEVKFSLASGKEKAGPLRTVKQGALYYQDKNRVLGTKLDFWKNRSTKITKYSRNALIHFEILPPINAKKLNVLKKDAADLIKIFCGGKVKVEVLDKKKSSSTI